MTDTSAWATAVAAYGLGPPKDLLESGPIEDAAWPRLLDVARSQRLMGLLRQAAHDGVLALQGGQWATLEEAYRRTHEQTVRAERSTAEIAETLEGAGIECRILKGPALAHLDYPSPELRPYVYSNLLVRNDEFLQTVALLKKLGFERAHAEPSPGFDARFRKGSVLASESGTVVELHRTIADGAYAMIVEHRELFRTSTPLLLSGVELSSLSPEERLLHACFEARVGDTKPLLIRLRDIVQLVLSHDLDIERVETLSGAWGAQSLVAEAVRRAWTLLGVTDMVPLSAWARTHRTTRGEKRRLLAYHRARSRSLVSVQALGAIRPRAQAFSYLKAVALPDRSYLEGHYSGHLSRWWRIAGSLAPNGSEAHPVRERLASRAPDDELLELSWARVAPQPA
jgi:Uncharacterised nucleotidyltransferase